MNLRLVSGLAGALALAGCATAPSPAVTPPGAEAAAEFSARSLADPALHRFLVENLGSDPQDAWDFESLSWVAFYYHPSLQVARAHWASLQAARRTAAARPNPTISLIPGYNTNNPVGVSPWLPSVTFDFLFQGKKRERQMEVAAAEAEIGRLGVLSAVWQVRSDLRHALIDLNVAATRERALADEETAQGRVLALLNARLEAGRLSATEVSTARLAQLREFSARAAAHNQIAAARGRLAIALGLPVSALGDRVFPLPAAPALSADALAAARRESLQTRPDVMAALAKFASAQSALALEVARRRPDLHLGPGYQFDQGADKWTLALTFELPIFNHNEGPIGEALAHRAEAAAQFSAAQAQAIGAIDSALLAQTAAAEEKTRAAQVRTEAKAQVDRTAQRIEAGAGDQLDRALAEVDAAAAESAMIEAAVDSDLAAGQLEDALQIPFPNILALADAAHPPVVRAP